MTNKKSKSKKQEDTILFAFLAVFLSIIGFVIALVTKRDNKYVMFYAKQSLILFIAWVIVWVAGSILTLITFGLFGFAMVVIWLFFVILWVIQIIYSLSGEEKITPLIGQFADKIEL